ncbi:hypothetical protein [Paenibacillus kobensis]|nr:hypothetical protein [Paenibacillus kobensis]
MAMDLSFKIVVWKPFVSFFRIWKACMSNIVPTLKVLDGKN